MPATLRKKAVRRKKVVRRKKAVRRPKKRSTSLLVGFDTGVEEQSALDQYLRDVSRHELITPEQEKVLGARAQLGDEEAV